MIRSVDLAVVLTNLAEILFRLQLKDNLNTDDDAEDEDIEQCAISEFWRFEEEARRWSRMDSKASATDSPTPRLSSSDHSRLPQHYMDEIREVTPSDFFILPRFIVLC